jgi:ribose transport system ATP-binding protein
MAAPPNGHVGSQVTGDTGPVVDLRGVSKTFGHRRVLSDVDLAVHPGEVHALLGKNGSGKSTLIKILAGYQPPDQGAQLLVRGERVMFPLHPNAPTRMGFSFVHQDLGLIPSMTVAETIIVGRFDTKFGWRISWAHERRRVERIIAEYGVDVSPDTLIEALSAVDRSLVAIMRALDRLKDVEGGLLVLDEPTAALPRDNVERLFDAVHEAARRGAGVLLVTHRLDEVRQHADAATVLRDGKWVDTRSTSGLTEDELVERIIGFPLDRLYPAHRQFVPAEAQFEVANLSGSTVRDVSVSVAPGEVLGVTGLLGMGADELPYLMFGAKQAGSGRIRVREKSFAASQWKPRTAMRAGLAFMPADRLQAGGVREATVRENLTLNSLSTFSNRLWLNPRRESARAWEMVREHNVLPQDPEAPLGTLSGGNQQKALLGKWFAMKPSVLLLHDPTRGIDVGAKKQVFSSIRQAAVSGTSVIIASDEYEDLANLCDRVLILGGGLVTCELSGSELTYERVLERCYAAVPPTTPSPPVTGSDQS